MTKSLIIIALLASVAIRVIETHGFLPRDGHRVIAR